MKTTLRQFSKQLYTMIILVIMGSFLIAFSGVAQKDTLQELSKSSTKHEQHEKAELPCSKCQKCLSKGKPSGDSSKSKTSDYQKQEGALFTKNRLYNTII